MTSSTGVANSCTLCGSDDASVLIQACGDILLGVPGQWDVLLCSNCGATFTAPRPPESELLDYYPPQYHVYHPNAPVRGSIAGAAIRRIAMFPYTARYGDPDWRIPPFGSRRMLDVGCGTGAMLRRMAALGWRPFGIDLSPVAIEMARQTVPDATLELGTLTNFEPKERFALISVQHVLEHLPDPSQALNRCHELLEPGGQLLVSVPNIDSFEARLFGRKWVGLDIPRHLTHFSRSTLTRTLHQSGFEELHVRPALFASFLSESVSLVLPRGIGRRLLGSTMGRLLYFASVFPASLSYVFGNAPVLEVLCRRRERS